jgi:hypothetical protein
MSFETITITNTELIKKTSEHELPAQVLHPSQKLPSRPLLPSHHTAGPRAAS